VILGGCLLAWLSATVNIGFLINLGTSVSHLTGDISRVAVHAVSFEPGVAAALASLFLATSGFVAGAAFAGYYICHPTLEFSRPYGRSMVIISVLLFTAHYLFTRSPRSSILLASTACGLQNAMATHYRGVILRTTHMTGILTDLGSNLGMKLAGHHIPMWKIAIPLMLSASFFGGSLFGAAIILIWDLDFLVVGGGLYLGAGLIYMAVKGRLVKLHDITPQEARLRESGESRSPG
jgi:uncharacterized membrane protein YoaK (UPF0700 family)